MKQEIKAPSVGESITEVRIAKWRKETGEAVKNGEVVIDIESDKATVEVISEADGVLNITRKEGETVNIGEVLGFVDTDAKPTVSSSSKQAPTPAAAPTPVVAAPSVSSGGSMAASTVLSPAVKKMVSEQNVDPSQISGTGLGGRITKGDVISYVEKGSSSPRPIAVSAVTPTDKPGERRVPMSMLRQRIAERLVHAQHTAAILTTFNECDMTAVNAVRAQHKEAFKQKHGVSLSFMSFFVRATIEALKEIPSVNARIDGKDIIFHDFHDIGIAVGTDRGLVVPVLRNAGSMGFADIEKGIGALATKARDGKLSIPDLTGGTFTISNGGTYGSLMSTPILNPPQSGILGMHKIQERPMAVNGQVAIRPMMYIALSYDHRIIDGKEAVTFLVKVKEGIENPAEKLGWSM
ncbi:MAG: 2-oxoglutarate dehydrogenase complex dihydrolipoyllysine-residue succinyltransferase [Bacteriovoracia bacterium]